MTKNLEDLTCILKVILSLFLFKTLFKYIFRFFCLVYKINSNPNTEIMRSTFANPYVTKSKNI
jgi:hypothetical protein